MRLLLAARAIDRMAGGVERMIISLANAMAARGHEVELFTWDRMNAEAYYPISSAIQWRKLNLGDVTTKASPLMKLRRAFAARKIVSHFRPDVVTAFQGGVFKALRLYCVGLHVPMIAAERNAPTLYEHTSAGQKGLQKDFRAFRMARFLVVQCEAYLEMHPPYLQNKLLAISNPVYPANGRARPHVPNAEGRYRLLAVGRLCYQKNFECLLVAFEQLMKRFPLWDLVIFGEGEYREKLESIIRNKNLSSRVFLAGVTKDPFVHYKSSHLFCLPSRWEGFPNALAEALAHGLPAVGFSDSAGVNVLIEHNKTGLLADGNGEPKTLVRVLSTMMDDADGRRVMGLAASASMEKYDPDIIMNRWEELFRQAVQ